MAPISVDRGVRLSFGHGSAGPPGSVFGLIRTGWRAPPIRFAGRPLRHQRAPPPPPHPPEKPVPPPRVVRVPIRLPTRVASSATMTSAPRVRVVAIPRARSKSPRCPPWPIRSRMARSRSRAVAPEMAEGRPPRPRAALLATNASRAKIVVARVRPTRARSAVAVVVPASRVKMAVRARPKTRPHRNRPPANSARKRI